MSGIESWSTTPTSNTTVDGDSGTDIDESCSPAAINNALRAVLANVAILRDLLGGAIETGGTADAQTLTTGLSLSADTEGLPLGFKAGAGLTNTGACTLNVDGNGAVAIKGLDGNDPAAGAITAGGIYWVAFDGTNYLLLTAAVTAGLSSYLPLAGGEMSGALNMGGQDINNVRTFYINERAAALSDTAGRYQLWVKNATPNELWGRDDAGNDYEIAYRDDSNVGLADSATVPVNFNNGHNKYFNLTISQDSELQNPTNPRQNQDFRIKVVASGANRELTFTSNWKMVGFSSITITSGTFAVIEGYVRESDSIVITNVVNGPS